MPVTFENDNDIIVYALECVISHARRTQLIFVVQSVWWLASIIGLQQESVSHIDKLQEERKTTELQGEKNTIPQEQLPREVSATPRDLAEGSRVDQLLDRTEQYLKESKYLREIVALKTSGTTATGRINPLKKSNKYLRKAKRISKDIAVNKRKNYSKTEGIDKSELQRRKAAGECLHCAWPSDKKGNHQVKDCRRQIKLDKGTVGIASKGSYQKSTESFRESESEDSSSTEGLTATHISGS